MSESTHSDSSALQLPDDVALPFFSYGHLKPNELAFTQIESFTESNQETAVNGRLYLRDGLPLLDSTTNGTVKGFCIRFRTSKEAYEAICRFEPAKHYKWGVSQTSAGDRVNILLGIRPSVGSEPLDAAWSSLDDPVFKHALKSVQQVIAEHGEVFDSAPPDAVDWSRFFRLEMAYLLLWSVLERYTAFRFGPAVDPMRRIKALGEDDRFVRAFSTVSRTDEVFDSRDSRTKYRLDVANPQRSILYYYQIRNNMSHRGKGAWREANKLRDSLVELTAIAVAMLESARESREQSHGAGGHASSLREDT